MIIPFVTHIGICRLRELTFSSTHKFFAFAITVDGLPNGFDTLHECERPLKSLAIDSFRINLSKDNEIVYKLVGPDTMILDALALICGKTRKWKCGSGAN